MAYSVDAALVVALYDELLLQSFPADELESRETMLQCLGMGRSENGSAEAVVVLDEDSDTPIACAINYWYAGGRSCLLGYLAVARHRRRQGIAAQLLSKVTSTWQRDLGCDLAVVEIENPRYYPGEEPLARLRMYKPFCLGVLDIDFVVPLVDPMARRAEGFLLAVLHTSRTGLGGDGRSVKATFVEEFIHSYFLAAQGKEGTSDDQEASNLFAACLERDYIRLLPIMEFGTSMKKGCHP